jgi:hypothetical protein
LSPEPRHARFGGSSAGTWMNCTQQPVLAAQALRTGFKATVYGDHAAIGTAAHAYAETVLQGGLHDPDSPYYAATDEYIRHCTNLIAPAMVTNGRFGIETWVSLAKLWKTAPPDAGGWVDFWAIIGKDLHVVDFKHGTHAVEASSLQLKFYALGLLVTLDDTADITHITTTIAQPNAKHKDGTLRSHSYTKDEILEWGKEVKKTIDLIVSNSDQLTLREGPYCWFCSASKICPIQVARKAAVFDDGYVYDEKDL